MRAHSQRRRGAQAGVTLIELTVTSASLSVILGGVLMLMMSSRGAVEVATLQSQFLDAQRLAPDEPEAKLAYALVLLYHGRTSASLKEFREVAVAHSDSMPAFHALSYQYFIKDQAEDGFRVLERLAAALPASDRYGPYETHVLKWTGTLLGYSLLAGGSPPPREAVDRLVGQVRSRGPQATKICNDEYAAVRRLAERTADARARADLRTYAKFDFDAVEQYLRAGMKN